MVWWGGLLFYRLVCAHAVGYVAGGGAGRAWDCGWDWRLVMDRRDSGMEVKIRCTRSTTYGITMP